MNCRWPAAGEAPDQGLAFDVQPRFSPDGKQIAYTSDRAGGNNLWRMTLADGKSTQVSKESFRLLNNPAWTPDGQYLIGRKHFTRSARWVPANCGCTTWAAATACS
jgi:Tol biopolymer transport system component